MDKKQLQNILSASYNAENWKQVLTEVFGIKRLHTQPKPIALPANDKAEQAFELGSLDTADDRLVGVYEVKVKPEVWLERNRVGLRQLLRNIYKYDVDGALIVFVQGDQWRFSYVSQIRTEKGKLETEPKRFTYLFGPNEICRTATERFLQLKGKTLQLNDLYNAFSVEKLNKDFFETYKEYYKKFWQYLVSVKEYRELLADFKQTDVVKQEKPIRDFAKKLLGRIVFLQFLQKKGWMGVPAQNTEWKGGDKRFIQSLFEKSTTKATFHSQVLKTLFFETLNTKRPNDLASKELITHNSSLVKVPYLNGGLFEKDISFDNPIDFPEEYFAQLLDFFEQYNFTIDENDPYDSEVGIDPEMLGHIFENLLEENKDKGAFYTPKEIVHYMCQESLTEYLKTHLPEQDHHNIEQLVRNNLMSMAFTKQDKAVTLNNLLKSVKICDPAIGSGAFPMGLLKEIFECRRLLYPYLKTLDAFDPAEIKKEIIQENIYGVDLDAGAVDIARLRFWLALVVDETVPQPLPNLDYKIMQGNSLLEQFENIPLSNLQNNKQVVYTVDGPNQMNMFGNSVGQQVRFDVLETKLDSLEQHINEYFKTEDQARKKVLKEKINAIIHEHLHFNIDLKKGKQEILLAEAKAKLDSIKFYENDTIAKRKQKEKQKEVLEKEAASLESEIQRLEEVLVQLDTIQETNDRPYFLWHLMFKDVFEKGGFDIVIGNPPYVRQEMLGKENKEAFQINFNDVYNSSADLYVYFYSLGLRLAKPQKGVLSFITPNKWMERSYGNELRKRLKSLEIKLIVNYGELKVFQEAATEPMIILINNRNSSQDLKYAILKSQSEIAQTSKYPFDNYEKAILSSDIWRFTNIETNNILTKIQKNSVSLNQYTNGGVYYGIKTGLNKAFIVSKEIRDIIISEDPKSAEIIKPMLEGKDFNKYKVLYKERYMIATQFELDIPTKYPAVFNYLSAYKDELIKRDDKGKNWWNLRSCDYYDKLEKNKIIYYHTARNHNFYLDTEGYYISANCYMIANADRYLQAILNSKFFGYIKVYLFPAFGDGENGGRIRLDANKMINFPIPIASDNDKKNIEKLVERILEYQTLEKDSTIFEHKIDALVFQMYGLSEKEIVHILESLEELGKAHKAEIQGYYRDIQKGTFSIEA